jgi:putative ABC transport system permease protein
MNVVSRGIRNAFRNSIRTVSIVVILGLSVGLALSMLVAYQAVGKKITSVKASVGNTVSISPAGVRGFEGGGTALTETELAKVKALAHVTALDESLSDRLTTSDTNLVSAITAGSLGQRFAGNSGQSFSFQGGGGGGDRSGSASSSSGSTGTVTQTFTPPITVEGTTDPTNLDADSATSGGGTFTLKSGTVFSSTSSADVALVGTTLATKNNLKVGSTFTAYSKTITVAGIFDAGNTFSNDQIIMPLTTVQTLSSQAGDITSATATVDSITNVASVTSATEKALGSAADVTNAAAAAQTTIAPLQNIQTISLYSLIGAVIAGAVIILLTMIMIVRERRREIGVIKAIGASNVVVMGQFMVEAVTLTVLGAVIGIVLGVVAGNPITKLLVNNSTSSTTTTATTQGGPGGGAGFGAARATRGLHASVTNIHAAVGWTIILDGLAAAIIIALVGSAMASFFIAKIRPAEVMRVE